MAVTGPGQHPDPTIGKVQELRLIDVFVLGPVMIYVGVRGRMPASLRGLAVIGGVATILYNWRNFRRLEEHRRPG